jgi:hypothetical protein
MHLAEPVESRRALGGQMAVVGLWLGVVVTGSIVAPDRHGHGTHRQLGLPPCPSVLVFDRPCPGCGLTTSWTALLHGDFTLAFRAHPLGPILFGLFTVAALLSAWGVARTQKIRFEHAPLNQVTVGTVVCLIAFGAYRFATTPHFGVGAERLIQSASRR